MTTTPSLLPRSSAWLHSLTGLPPLPRQRLVALCAAGLALLIFITDTFTPLHIAVAVMYIIVVLLAATSCGPRGIAIAGAACAALAMASFFLTHSADAGRDEFGRTIMSVVAIATATLLAINMWRVSDALRRNEGYLSEAAKLSRTGSFALDMESGKYRWSDETYRIFEYDPYLQPTVELVQARLHPDDREVWASSIDGRGSGHRAIDIHYRLQFPDGRIKHIHALAHPVNQPDGTREYVGALMDVTLAKQAEDRLHEAREALAHVTRMTTLGELVASIAHEVNQPLAGIVTNGEACVRWLERAEPDLDEARGAVHRMIGDGRRAGEIIQRLQALSRKGGHRSDTIGINETIEEAIKLVRLEILNSRVALHPGLAGGLPMIEGNKIELQQVIINLLMNAIQATSKSQARPRQIWIMTRQLEDGAILVQVRDNGSGIEAGHFDRLFEAFFTTRDAGIGMGLSICRSVVEAHGGRIWAENNPGGGATFSFTLKPVKDEV